MPECSEIAAMLSDYLDRDLPPDTCSVIEAHLRSCPNCDRSAAGLRRTVSLCRQYRSTDKPGPLPPDKQREMRAAFENALEAIKRGRS